MPQDLDSLREVLADRYAVERQLGRGGMATVYLAQDLKHHRPVAIKVLKPELAAALGPDRFLREIEVTAGLHHPNILPLYDSGRIDRSVDLLYYVMPYVDGESLRDRLERERQLPLEEALQLTREVAEALGYAHSRGVIHRDIKPENILLENGHALVADFGIAKAVTAAGGERLTETGLSIGTPAYMSPEQAGGHDQVDARSDLYSLGCVLYEMLAGHPPFQGTTAHELLARHASDPVPPLRTGRATIPEPIEAAVERVLAKVPADRYATAQQFSTALQIDAVSYRRRRRLLKRVQRLAVGAAVLLVVAAGALGVTWYRQTTAWKSRPVSRATVAVFPFRVSSADPAILELDEGMIDLLHAVLTGEIGPRSVNPGALLLAWKSVPEEQRAADARAALEVASRFGAGQVLEGSLVQAGAQLTMTGWLRSVPEGDELSRYTVQVAAESVNVLPYRLAIGLLGSQLGEDGRRLHSLAAYDPQAVAAYLAGVRARRGGNPLEAYERFEQAQALDSTFALPVLTMALLDVFKPGDEEVDFHTRNVRATRRARQLQESLSPRDRAALVYRRVVLREDTATTRVDALDAVERWADLAPDDPDALLAYAAELWNMGDLAQRRGWEEQASVASLRAWQLDSLTPFRVALHARAALDRGDAAWIDRVFPVFQARVDSTSEDWASLRWLFAQQLGDSATVRGFRQRLLAGDPAVLSASLMLRLEARRGAMPEHDLLLSIDSAVAHGVLPVLARIVFYVPAGRVVAGTELLLREGPFGWMILAEWATAYAGMDRAVTMAVDSLNAFAARRPDSHPLLPCVVVLHRAWWGDTVDALGLVRQLQPRFEERGELGICPAMVEAIVEAHRTPMSTTPALDRLEQLARLGPDWEWPSSTAMLLVARLCRARGDLNRALAAAGDAGVRNAAFYQNLRPPYLREEAELATLVGDTARAIRAFSEYLNIRVAPDPGVVQAEVDSVRVALNALLRAKG